MRDPNDARYFDEDKGCTLNKKCSVCPTMVWVQSGVHTTYIGKKYTHNKPPYKVMSVMSEFGIVCQECFENLSK